MCDVDFDRCRCSFSELEFLYLLYIVHEVVPPAHKSCVVVVPNILNVFYAADKYRSKIELVNSFI
jgi:hypothetical protein